MPTYTAYWSAWMCKEAREHGFVGRPLRILEGGWNQETDYGRYRFGPGDQLMVVSIDKGGIYVIAEMTVTEKTTRADWVARHPRDRSLTRSHGGQIVAGKNGTVVRFDQALSPDLVESIEFQSGKKTRPLKFVEDGRLKRALGLQGVFRLTEGTAEAVRRALAGEGFEAADLKELHTRLLEKPKDEAAWQVLADALIERGDLRGEVLQIEHTLSVTQDKSEQKNLRKRLDKLVTEHYRALVGRPGGYPYRAAWGPPRV